MPEGSVESEPLIGDGDVRIPIACCQVDGQDVVAERRGDKVLGVLDRGPRTECVFAALAGLKVDPSGGFQ